jgi:hypothetical protein
MKKMAVLTLVALASAFALSLGCDSGEPKEDGKDVQISEDGRTGDAVTGDDVPLPCADVCEDTAVPPADALTPPDSAVEQDLPPVEDTPVQPDVVLPSSCEEVESFEPCGGNVEGNWKWDAICMDMSAFGENPFADTCPAATMSADIVWDATVEFKDGTYTTNTSKQTTTIVFNIPKTCLPQGAGCEVFGADMNCVDSGEACDCTSQKVDEEPKVETGTYEVEGTNLVMTNSDGEVTTAPVCVAGDKVVAKITDTTEEGKTITLFFILSRL